MSDAGLAPTFGGADPRSVVQRIIDSYVVVHQPIGTFASDVPYVMTRIVLDGTGGHANVSSNVADCPWDQVRVRMRVTVFFDDVTDNVTLPKFRTA
jgi:hypothetical protein